MDREVEKRAIATKDDWRTTPMPKRKAKFILKREFTDEQMEILRCGNIPMEMEDKWFWFMEGDTLYAHRSWTGICIYSVKFKDNNKHVVTVNRDKKQYGCRSLREDKEMLNDLLDYWIEKPYDYYREWLNETHKAIRNSL